MFHISAEACFMAWVAWGLCCYISTAAWKTEVVVLCALMSVPPFVSCVGRNVIIYSILMPPRTHFWALNVKLGGESSRCWKNRRGLVCCVGGKRFGGSWLLARSSSSSSCRSMGSLVNSTHHCGSRLQSAQAKCLVGETRVVFIFGSYFCLFFNQIDVVFF